MLIQPKDLLIPGDPSFTEIYDTHAAGDNGVYDWGGGSYGGAGDKVTASKHSELMVVVRYLRMNITRQTAPMVGISQALILIVLHLGLILLPLILHLMLAM